MIIDSHQHFWRYKPTRDVWITEEMAVLQHDFLPDDFEPELDRNGVAATIAVQASQSDEETRFLLDLAASNDRICGVVGWVDLQNDDVEEHLGRLRQFAKLRGFRHIAQDEPDDSFLVRPTFVRGVRAMAQFGFTYDILIYSRQLPAAIQLVEQCPGQRFVLDHLGKPPIRSGEIDGWARNVLTLAKAPDVYCKLSGMVTENDWRSWRAGDFTPYLDVVFEAFGSERLMFGSDWPVCLLAASYAQVKEILEEYIRRRLPGAFDSVFALSASNFYGVRISDGLAPG